MTPSLVALVTALALAVASMGAYALLGRRSDEDARRKGATFLLGVGDFFVHWFMWAIGPLERLLLALGVGPDAMNLAGLAFGALAGALIAAGRLELGGWAIALGGVCDILDGRLARARKVVSAYGAFIDSTLDRFVEVFAFLGFVYYLRAFAWGPLLAAAAITGSLLVSYTRARGESVGVLCKEGLMQRAERLVLTCLACLSDAPLSAALRAPRGSVVLWTVALIAAGTFLTAGHRTLWISARLRERG
ncbi:MAG TPA: CDP-alcohol phosphatidyltransferase family protein [Vicinamibacteria bacterium]|nr:CDP-alcohol phosphatidyltransferase family protein [Vicinamibacteria bacterium]